jgi:hypothetical protein
MLWKRHSQAGLQMLFHNISPLGNQAQPIVFSHFDVSREARTTAVIRAAKVNIAFNHGWERFSRMGKL